MQTTNLTDLPTELLSNIMRQLHEMTRQHTLLAFCTVNRRLPAIVRDELYTSPSISPTWAPQVVAQLINRTKTAAKTTQLTIQHIQTEKEAMTTSFMDGDLDGSGFAGRKSVQALNIQCQDALQSHGIRDDFRHWLNALQSADSFTYLAVRLAITPALKRLTLSHQFASALAQQKGRCGVQQPQRPYISCLLKHALLQLEELRLEPMQRRYSLCTLHHNSNCSFQNLDLGSLSGFKRFEVPAHTLMVYPNTTQSIQIQVLSPSIQELQITYCNWRAVELLSNSLANIRKDCSELEEVVCIWGASGLDDEIPGYFTGMAPAQHQNMYKAAQKQGIRLRWINSNDTEEKYM
jgi:hypothetical protein